MRIIPVSRVL